MSRSPGTPSLLLLTAAAAATDAVGYLGLGKVFPANMTGNTVLLAIGLVSGRYARAARSGLALAAFVTATVITGATRPKIRLRILLCAELAVLSAAAAWWIAGPAEASGARRLGLIVLVGTAMGMQSAVVAGLDAGVSTTFITGTWTAAGSALGGWLRHGAETGSPDRKTRHQIVVLASYLAAALLSGYLEVSFGPWAMVIPPACLVAGTIPAWLWESRRR